MTELLNNSVFVPKLNNVVITRTQSVLKCFEWPSNKQILLLATEIQILLVHKINLSQLNTSMNLMNE